MRQGVPSDASLLQGDSGRLFSEPTTANIGVEQSTKKRPPDDLTKGKMAQFQWPPRPTRPGPQEQPGPEEQYTPKLGAPPRPVTQFLKYQYSYGSESDIIYRRNPDLNNEVKDDSLILVPQVNGLFIYRPTNWLEATLEMIFDWEIAAHRQKGTSLIRLNYYGRKA